MPQRRRSFEDLECPLRKTSQCQKQPKNLKGPLRVIQLCLLGITVPSLFIGIPLYMRYRVYGQQLYPLAMSDMRLLDNKISTTWCQRQLVKVNTTFNAFLLSRPPELSPNIQTLSMVRHLELEDDTKEYWGFYLLKGSSVTVSTCTRWPGASLIVIRGHKHLHECAYIGDNSSEELDELMEAIQESPSAKNEDDAPTNDPDLVKRYREDVEFHHPVHKNSTKNHTLTNSVDITDIDIDADMMKKILLALKSKSTKKSRKIKQDDNDDNKHVHRNSTIAKDETKNVKIEMTKTNRSASEEVFGDIIKKLHDLGEKGAHVLNKVNEKYTAELNEDDEHVYDIKGRHYSKPPVKYNENIDYNRRKRDLMLEGFNGDDEENDLGIEEGFIPDGIADHHGNITEPENKNDMSNSEFWSSFSSSEEALLNCDGLILNLPLTPHHKCHKTLNEDEAEETFLANTVTYKVPANGYYFFVFSSENEVQTNYLRIKFNLKKTVYNVSNPVELCTNNTETCAVNLSFFSSEKLVMELPVKENDTLWNEEFIVESECEPRTAIYAVCVIIVPVIVILFAFS